MKSVKMKIEDVIDFVKDKNKTIVTCYPEIIDFKELESIIVNGKTIPCKTEWFCGGMNGNKKSDILGFVISDNLILSKKDIGKDILGIIKE